MAPRSSEPGIIRHVFLSTVSNYIGKIVGLATWFLLTPFILEQLGAPAYGLWVLVGSVTAYGALFDFGVAAAVTKYVAEYDAKGESNNTQALIATALSLYTVLALIVISLSALLAPVFPVLFNVQPEEGAIASRLVLLSGFGVGLSIPCATSLAILRGFQRFDLLNLISVIHTLIAAGATVGVLLLGGGALGMVAANIGVMLLMQIPSVWYIHRIAPELHYGWRGSSLRLVRTVTSYSASMFMLNIGGQLETKTDEIVIGAWLPVQAVTPYSIARKLSSLPQTLAEQFLTLLLPLASKLHAGNEQMRLRMLYLISTRLTLAVFMPIGAILTVLARPILTVWIGPAYADYAHIVLILILASLIDTSVWPAGFILQGMGRHRYTAVLALCAGLSNLVLSVVLVRSLGLTGVALGTLIPTALICLGFVTPYAMRVIGVSRHEVMTQIYLPAMMPIGPMLLVLYGMQVMLQPLNLWSLLFAAIVSGLVYVLAYLIMGSNELERQTCRSFALSAIQLVRIRFGLP